MSEIESAGGRLTFAAMREKNVARCETDFQMHSGLMGWNPAEWACALAGEVGEACNPIKKRLRGDEIETGAIAAELADIQAYLDLLAARLEIDLGDAFIAKFNEVSERIGSKVFFDVDPTFERDAAIAAKARREALADCIRVLDDIEAIYYEDAPSGHTPGDGGSVETKASDAIRLLAMIDEPRDE